MCGLLEVGGGWERGLGEEGEGEGKGGVAVGC